MSSFNFDLISSYNTSSIEEALTIFNSIFKMLIMLDVFSICSNKFES